MVCPSIWNTFDLVGPDNSTKLEPTSSFQLCLIILKNESLITYKNSCIRILLCLGTFELKLDIPAQWQIPKVFIGSLKPPFEIKLFSWGYLRTRPNSALDLRRRCTSLCEQSICKVQIYRNEIRLHPNNTMKSTVDDLRISKLNTQKYIIKCA